MSRSVSSAVAVVVLLMAFGCSQPQATHEAALLVTVEVQPQSVAQCVRVVVTPATGSRGVTAPLARKGEIKVAVYRAADWSDQVTVVARAYPDCTPSTPVEDFTEESEPLTRGFPSSTIESITLVLPGVPVAVDADKDDHPAGPDDCNDTEGSIYLGAPETCTDTADRNCSNTRGCADPLCTGSCAGGDAGVCRNSVCFTGDVELICDDGQSNDTDSDIDCADSDCDGETCTDQSACTTNDQCIGTTCVGGTVTNTCTTPRTCETTPGQCIPADGGCSYPVDTNGTCTDNNSCTVGDACQVDAGCAPSNVVSCAVNEPACEAAMCVSPSGCQTVSINDGGLCQGGAGKCASGVCGSTLVPFALDGGGVSNINPALDAGRIQPPTFINCPATFATGGGVNAAAVFTFCDGGVLTSADGGIEIYAQPNGGLPIAVVRFAALIIGDAGIINFRGDRPAVIAVFGDMTHLGVLDLSPPGGKPAGSDNLCGAGAASGATESGNGSSGGGGGAYGATGGNGGSGGNSSLVAAGGLANGSPQIIPLRGGCRGGNGGAGASTPNGVAEGGPGGGAIQLSVSGKLTIDGMIHAVGGGGHGGFNTNNDGAGGAGAGSGGSILLESEHLVVGTEARLFANGGVGGEGGDGSQGTPVGRGAQVLRSPFVWGSPPGPASSNANAGDGAAGGGGNGPLAGSNGQDGQDNNNDPGGGGGGGSVGRIYFNFDTVCRESGYVISPSTAATTGDVNTAFTMRVPWSAAVTTCP